MYILVVVRTIPSINYFNRATLLGIFNTLEKAKEKIQLILDANKALKNLGRHQYGDDFGREPENSVYSVYEMKPDCNSAILNVVKLDNDYAITLNCEDLNNLSKHKLEYQKIYSQ